MKTLIHESNYQSDKSFGQLGIMCVNETCDSTMQEGSSQKDQGLVCKISEHKYPSFTPTSWYSNSCASCTIDNAESGLFDFKDITETISWTAGQLVMATKVVKKRMLFFQADKKLSVFWAQSKFSQMLLNGSFPSPMRCQMGQNYHLMRETKSF